jgi:AraC-like DNA-binding protein
MSNPRHAFREPPVRGYAVTHPAGRATLPAQPGWDQLVYAESGTMRVATPGGSWFIPPHRALWIPAGATASVSNRSRVAVRALYFDSGMRFLPFEARAFTVTGLAHALLLHAARTAPLDPSADAVQAALLTLLADRLRSLPAAPLWLPWPADPRAADAAESMMADPAATPGAVARSAGASRRTLERIFAAETGLGLGAWRRRAAILVSLDRLAAGGTVTAAAMAAGYTTPSAYVVAFKRELGHTPGEHLRP